MADGGVGFLPLPTTKSWRSAVSSPSGVQGGRLSCTVTSVFCVDILQLYSIGLSFVWHSVYFVQL